MTMTATAVAEVAAVARATATATEAVAEGVAWMGRAGGGALELMAGRGYAIWGMQNIFVPPMHFEVAQIYMCIHCP